MEGKMESKHMGETLDESNIKASLEKKNRSCTTTTKSQAKQKNTTRIISYQGKNHEPCDASHFFPHVNINYSINYFSSIGIY